MPDTKNQRKTISIQWKPDRNSNVPLYSQIVTYFSQQISRGDWVGGQLIPSQRYLSELFEVNRSTIVEAMCELTSMGLIEGRYGGGTRISNEGWIPLIQARVPNWHDYLKAGRFQPNTPTVQAINRLEFEPGITRMSTGELSPDLVQSELTKQALANLSQRKLYMNYPDPLGMPGLRAALQGYLRKMGIDVPISCILIVSGALQALQLISNGIVRARSTIFVESPSYLRSLNIFQSVGAALEGIPMDAQGIQPWRIPARKETTRYELLYTIPTFQNPTGCVMPEERRRELLKSCAKHHIPIVEDDVFCDLWLDEPPPLPVKALDQGGSVVYIGSISKCFSPGLRLGWLVGPEAVVDRLADIKMQMDYGVSVLPQQVIEELLRSGLYYEGTDAVRVHLRKRRDLMLQLLEYYFKDLAQWTPPTGSFFIWVRLKNRVSAERVFQLALEERMLVPPGSIYDPAYASCLRLTFGYLSEAEMERGMRRLSEIVRSLN